MGCALNTLDSTRRTFVPGFEVTWIGDPEAEDSNLNRLDSKLKHKAWIEEINALRQESTGSELRYGALAYFSSMCGYR